MPESSRVYFAMLSARRPVTSVNIVFPRVLCRESTRNQWDEWILCEMGVHGTKGRTVLSHDESDAS